MENKRKIAIVVGGAKSLGLYISKKLVENKYKVIIFDIDKVEGEKIIKKFPSKNLEFFKGNAFDEKDIKKVIQKLESRNEKIDTLIYNAGIAKANKITKLDINDLNISLNVNLIGYALFIKHVSNHMIKNNIEGYIININSKSGKEGSKHNAAYSSAKFGAVGVTQSAALDLAEHKINVNSLMLGNLLESKMFKSLIPQYSKKLNIQENEVLDYYINKVPLKRGCTFEDVVNVLLFYISEKAKYCTGQSINITGGQVMH